MGEECPGFSAILLAVPVVNRLPVDVALELHVGAAVTHEAVPDCKIVLLSDFFVVACEVFEVVAQAALIIGTIFASYRIVKRVNWDYAARTQVFGTLQHEFRGLLPLHLVLGFQFDACHHGGINVPTAPEPDREFKRLNPAIIADVMVLTRADL